MVALPLQGALSSQGVRVLGVRQEGHPVSCSGSFHNPHPGADPKEGQVGWGSVLVDPIGWGQCCTGVLSPP